MAIEKCHELTKRLHDTVTSDQLDRDEQIEKINSLLQEREILMKEVQKPQTDQENQLAKDIVEWNQLILKKMETLKLDIQKNIKETDHKKKTAAKYNNPYGETETQDGMFYDKRN